MAKWLPSFSQTPLSPIFLLDVRNIQFSNDAPTAEKHVKNMKLQNKVIQLRKMCCSRAHTTLCGRAAVCANRLGAGIRCCRSAGSRRCWILLTFTTLSLIALLYHFADGGSWDWAVDMKGWRICRIDGTTPPLGRRGQINEFQTAGDPPEATRLFLLSTRSDGLGYNYFRVPDWNSQMDAQAQDLARRIGQKKPALIFRLVSAHTIEENATEKRKLEALFIAIGQTDNPHRRHHYQACDNDTGKLPRTSSVSRASRSTDVLPSPYHHRRQCHERNADLGVLPRCLWTATGWTSGLGLGRTGATEGRFQASPKLFKSHEHEYEGWTAVMDIVILGSPTSNGFDERLALVEAQDNICLTALTNVLHSSTPRTLSHNKRRQARGLYTYCVTHSH
ncbi:hypothetical protein K438DRAFT_1767411 [Mycena galopus ATCC 62051]|nr:hypothetical protein K438DRAFT_1767411 [Mycena galopus ATCC 62051]